MEQEQQKHKRSAVEWAMHYRQIVILITCCLIAFGVFSLDKINKNEFPDFTVRTGVVVAAAPGVSAEDMEEEVTKPLENYIFSYKEVKKAKTKSYTKDGLSIVQVELNDDVEDKDEFWSKFKHGVQAFKSQLPSNVLAIQVQDDFGDTSSLLITMESNDKTYRELKDYMDALKDSLRQVESVGRLNVYGMEKEQISVYLDNEKLSHYGISDKTIALKLFQKGFQTMSGTQKSDTYNSPIYVKRSMNMKQDVRDIIVYSDPSGHAVRLGDVATVKREYPEPTSYITNNGKKCLLLSVEMKKGRNITEMGNEISQKMDAFQKTLPASVSLYKITDQTKVVNDSVINFLRELLIAIVAVVIVVMLLLPMRVALVAASTIPISIFISLGLFYAFGLELNTVTLAALIVTLGMIVDNSIVIIDSYMEKLQQGESRWTASIESANHFFKSIFSATLAISITFFPFLLALTGMYYDFIKSFPWAITIVLMISLCVAELIVPFLQFWFIREPQKPTTRKISSQNFLAIIQKAYDKILDICFAHPYSTVGCAVLLVVAGLAIWNFLPKQLLPIADRNQFAVEIYMPTGYNLKQTDEVADSLEHILRRDKRVESVATFHGCSSPRFHTAYAPQLGGENFAQFIVNTKSPKATEEVLEEYQDKYCDYFPKAYVRFKQLSYRQEVAPIELRLSGENLQGLLKAADSLTTVLRQRPDLEIVRNDMNEPLRATAIQLNEDEASRLLITNPDVELSTALRYNSDGIQLGTVWNGDYDVAVKLKSTTADKSTLNDVANERIAAYGGIANVPLRQVAQVKPEWHVGEICHRNGIRTVSILAETKNGLNALDVTSSIQKQLKGAKLPDGVHLTYGGSLEENNETNPKIMSGLAMAVVIIFFILLAHFRRIKTAVLLLVSLSLVVFGAAVGAKLVGVDWGVTCTLGIISLMGILVRNAIIMYDYAEELRETEKVTAHEAIYESAKRRMRPIFLTSAAASMGVIPMILGGSSLWMPMGSVICFGTLITMVLILTVLPIGYWLVMSGTTKKRLRSLALEKE